MSINGNITKDYVRHVNDTSVNLTQSINVNGNGHTVESNDIIEFKINDNQFYQFNNLTFKCEKLRFSSYNQSNFTSVNFTFNDCTFLKQDINSTIEVHMYGYDWGYGYSCSVTGEIKKLALKIIGKSKDLDAAKKLAVWVSKNIEYELSPGFYQSPTETLHRRMGNCCCQSDLLIQMMDAVGLTKNHKICYIHVGSNHFHKRHYFLMIDNLCVDPTLNSPWGHGKFSGRPAEITEYPVMPLPYGVYE